MSRANLWYPIGTMKRPSAPVPNPGYDRVRVILTEAGYVQLRTFQAKLDRGCLPSEDRFEVWAGKVPTQTVMLQVWRDGNGVSTYGTHGLGYTFDELKAVL